MAKTTRGVATLTSVIAVDRSDTDDLTALTETKIAVAVANVDTSAKYANQILMGTPTLSK